MLVGVYLQLLMLSLVVDSIMTENCAPGLQQLALPVADVLRMYPALAGQLVDCLQPLRRLSGQLEPHLRTIVVSFPGHQFAPPFTGRVMVPFYLNQLSRFTVLPQSSCSGRSASDGAQHPAVKEIKVSAPIALPLQVCQWRNLAFDLPITLRQSQSGWHRRLHAGPAAGEMHQLWPPTCLAVHRPRVEEARSRSIW